MAISPHRIVYLDNLRNVLVYNVVVLHVVQMFGYPLFFWWAVTDQEGSSRFYETGLIGMDIYEISLQNTLRLAAGMNA
ncbi:MAG TPA: hypothetical protein PK556_11595, partial [Smithellaceae bacterium]|nr:hypothetical protein [Smithellaceae bacterium]